MLEESKVKEFMSVQECARALELHPASIRRYIKQGKLKAFVVGRQRFKVRRVDFDQFYESLKYEIVIENKRLERVYQDSISNGEATIKNITK